jgi:hypothetical protein
MGHFPLLDIAIGLTLIYTFLSLLTSELTEFMTMVLRWRAKHLQRGIMTLLGESLTLRHHPQEFKQTLTGRLYYSSLIASITQRSRRYRFLVGPSYIPSTVFADALLEVLQALPEVERQAPEREQDIKVALNQVAQLVAKVEQSDQLPPQLKANLIRLAQRTQGQAKGAELEMEQFRDEIALWYDQSMDRLSGAYRRNVKAFTVLIGSVLAVLINVDSLYILRRLSENTATRTVIIQNAIQIQSCQTDLSSSQCMEKIADLLEETTLPIGWHPVNFQQQFPQMTWMLTGIAISMGSRFWFQILDQLVHVRETGDKPATAEEQQTQKLQE